MDIASWFPLLGIGFLTAVGVFAIGFYLAMIRFATPKLPFGAYAQKKKDVFAVLAVGLLLLGVAGGALIQLGLMTDTGTGDGDADGDGVTPSTSVCPSTGYTAVRFDVQNNINTATLEEFNLTMTCVGQSDTVTITDTSGTTATSNFVCGDTYTCYITSTAGAAGDGSYVQSILSGDGTITSDGQLRFTAAGAGQSFQLKVDQLGVTEARMWDVKNAAWMYDTGDASASDYETDGATFTSTTDNTTEMAVGTGGEVHVQMYIRSTAIDNALNDGRGLLIAFDGLVTTWDTPTMILDGQVLSDCKSSLDANEALALNTYEHVYCYTGSKTFAQNGEGMIDMQVFALSGQNPATGGTHDLQIDVIPRGQKASALNGNEFIQSAYDDTSSHTVMLQVDDYTIDIS